MTRMVSPDDELHWIQSCPEGDAKSYDALIEQHQKMVFAVAFRMTGSQADAEDLMQETFLRAFRQLDSFRGDSKFSTWLCQIAVNLGISWRQREHRRQAVHSKWAENASIDNGAQFPDELSHQVQIALNRIPAKQRAAIVLTVYEGRSHGEAARVLGCSEATVSWRVFAARQKLKHLLRGFSK